MTAPELPRAAEQPAVGAQVQRRVRPLTERLTMHADNKTKRAMQVDGEQAASAIDAALHEAIAAVYFDDGSDFKPALMRIVGILGGPSCVKLLEGNPRACYAASVA